MPRHTGFASLPLHGGKAPAWLFGRMVELSREIVIYLASEYGTQEVLRRLSDPFWFQAFGCVLGFDWHSSGVTTTVCGAVKEGLKDIDAELGFFAAGGKGGASRKTPQQIADTCDRLGRDAAPLVYASKTAAKVDSAAVQDGYQLYHHVFFFTAAGDWCVVQQGMSDANRHGAALSLAVGTRQQLRRRAARSGVLRRARRDAEPRRARKRSDPARVRNARVAEAGRSRWRRWRRCPTCACPRGTGCFRSSTSPSRHLEKILVKTYERAPENFEALLGIEGVGPKTLRALALASELVHGTPATMRDPARFSFAHGGKDGTPFPVDKPTYDKTIEVLNKAINRSAIDRSDKVKAFQRLAAFSEASPSSSCPAPSLAPAPSPGR